VSTWISTFPSVGERTSPVTRYSVRPGSEDAVLSRGDRSVVGLRARTERDRTAANGSTITEPASQSSVVLALPVQWLNRVVDTCRYRIGNTIENKESR
jgi:hypothetical protein